MIIRRSLVIFVFVLAAWLGPVRAESGTRDWAPMEQSLEYYRAIWTAMPFVPAVAAAGRSPMSEHYALTGYAHLGGGDVVFLLDRKSLTRFAISTQGGSSGSVISVANQGDLRHMTARIMIAGQVGVVSFDPGLAPGQGASTAPPAVSVRPTASAGSVGVTLPILTSASAEASPTPRPNKFARQAPISPQ